MKQIKVGILGPTGRMGKSLLSEKELFPYVKITELCESKNHKDIGKVISGIKLTGNINNLISNSQVIIDFSVPKATLSLVRALKDNSEVCLITGTTGFSEIQLKEFKKLSKGLRIMQSYNMSIGVNLLLSSVEFFSEKLGKGVDIEIIETHHKYKKDAPSGTALSIGEAVKRGRNSYEKNKFVYRGLEFNKEREDGEIGFSSIRGGDVVGEHTTHFIMNGERIEITHKASKREIFSRGALQAVDWIIKQKPGLYNLQDMLTSKK